MKKLTLDERISELVRQIEKSYNHWIELRDGGSCDPFWADGMQMNLVRNHIIYDKNQLKDLLAGEEQISFFAPSFSVETRPTPPEVPENYMCPTGVHLESRMKTMFDATRVVYSLDMEEN